MEEIADWFESEGTGENDGEGGLRLLYYGIRNVVQCWVRGWRKGLSEVAEADSGCCNESGRYQSGC